MRVGRKESGRTVLGGIAVKLGLNRKRLLAVVAVAAIAVVMGIGLYIRKLNRMLTEAQKQEMEAARVEVTQSRLRAPSADGVTVYLDSSDVRATATLDGVRYLATSGGLVQLDEGGGVKRRFTTLDGLPDDDLTALAVFRDRLYIGTSSRGLVSFDGNVFTGYSFSKPKATRVQTLAVTETELLIGTLDGGLFEFDGQRFTRRYNSTTGADFKRVTALLPLDSRLYIGTQDSGLYIWREAQMAHIGTSNGLPSPHVTGLVALRGALSNLGEVAVATDFGVVSLNDRNEVKPISNRPNITSLAVSGGRLWAGLFSGGVAELGRDQGDRRELARRTESDSADTTGLPRSAPTAVYAGDARLWALTARGAFFREEGSSRPAFDPVARSLSTGQILSQGHITSLAIDGEGHLWVGYFDDGIDTIDPESNERLSHIEDEQVREINYLKYDPAEYRVLAATSAGLVIFDRRLRETALTREKDGLINDSVEHVSLVDSNPELMPAASEAPAIRSAGQSIVLATAGGLTQISGGRVRSITAFHGLPSNHLYASATVGSKLFVGTLAGLAELDGLRVVRTYTTSNSRLSHNWVTALAAVNGTLYIGTNGGGVDALLPTGEWINFADDIGRFEVNQNAMYYDGERLYIGTGDRGLLVYNNRDRRWSRFNSAIPSQNVTAVTSDDRYVYAGTLNGLVRIEKRVIQ